MFSFIFFWSQECVTFDTWLHRALALSSDHSPLYAGVCWPILTYDVCIFFSDLASRSSYRLNSRPFIHLCMLASADLCWPMLTYADLCWPMLTYADLCWPMLASADLCWPMLKCSIASRGNVCVAFALALLCIYNFFFFFFYLDLRNVFFRFKRPYLSCCRFPLMHRLSRMEAYISASFFHFSSASFLLFLCVCVWVWVLVWVSVSVCVL
jgi:hypothetical protein